jgi:hypothetical protein
MHSVLPEALVVVVVVAVDATFASDADMPMCL